MRIVIQRVKQASVKVDNKVTGEIGPGILVFLGIGSGDKESDADFLAEKTAKLRIMEDSAGKMNLSTIDLKYSIMVISQFTLYGDCSKGLRPDFMCAEKPEAAEKLYNYFIKKIKEYGVPVAEGVFRANMEVSLINDGPVTIIIESKK